MRAPSVSSLARLPRDIYERILYAACTQGSQRNMATVCLVCKDFNACAMWWKASAIEQVDGGLQAFADEAVCACCAPSCLAQSKEDIFDTQEPPTTAEDMGDWDASVCHDLVVNTEPVRNTRLSQFLSPFEKSVPGFRIEFRHPATQQWYRWEYGIEYTDYSCGPRLTLEARVACLDSCGKPDAQADGVCVYVSNVGRNKARAASYKRRAVAWLSR